MGQTVAPDVLTLLSHVCNSEKRLEYEEESRKEVYWIRRLQPRRRRKNKKKHYALKELTTSREMKECGGR
jgi:hypothetical protein